MSELDDQIRADLLRDDETDPTVSNEPNLGPPPQADPSPGGFSPGPSDLRKAIIQDLRKDDSELLNEFEARQALKRDPQREARVSRVWARSGIPKEIVRENLERYEAELRSGTLSYESIPTSLRLQMGKNADAIVHDVSNMSGIAWLINAPLSAFATGVREAEFNIRSFAELAGLGEKIFGPGNFDEIMRLEREVLPATFGEEGFFERAIVGAARMLPQMIGAAGFGATAAAIAGQVGPQAAFPEEVATVPFGAAAGGAFLWTSLQESGSLFHQIRMLETPDGEKIDPAVARGLALAGGSVSGSLELLGLGLVFRTFRGSRQALTRLAGKKLADAWRYSPSFRVATGKALASYSGALVGEPATEMGQEIVQIVSTQLAAKIQGGDFDVNNVVESWDRVLDAGIKAFEATFILGGIGATGSLVTHRQQAHTAKINTARMAALLEYAKQSESRTSNPSDYRNVLRVIAQQAGSPKHVYLPIKEFVRFHEEAGVDPRNAAIELLDDSGKQYMEALDIGADLIVPIESFLEKMPDSKVVDQLLPHTRLFQGQRTLGEVDEVRQRMFDDLQDLKDKPVEEMDSDHRYIYQRMHDAARDDGGRSEAESDVYGRIAAAFFVTQAREAGIAPIKFFEEHEINIRRGAQVGDRAAATMIRTRQEPSSLGQIIKRAKPGTMFRSISPEEALDVQSTGQVTGRGNWFSGDPRGLVFFGDTVREVIHHGEDVKRQIVSRPDMREELEKKEALFREADSLQAEAREIEERLNSDEKFDRLAAHRRLRAIAPILSRSSKKASKFQQELFAKMRGEAGRIVKERRAAGAGTSFILEFEGLEGGTRFEAEDSLAGAPTGEQVPAETGFEGPLDTKRLVRVHVVRSDEPRGVDARVVRTLSPEEFFRAQLGAAVTELAQAEQRQTINESAPTEFLKSLDYRVEATRDAIRVSAYEFLFPGAAPANRAIIEFKVGKGELLPQSIDETFTVGDVADYLYRIAEEITGLPVTVALKKTGESVQRRLGRTFARERKFADVEIPGLRTTLGQPGLRDRDILIAEQAPTELLRNLRYSLRHPPGQIAIDAQMGETAVGAKVRFAVVAGELYPETIEVHPSLRRAGLASYLYRIAEVATGLNISDQALRTRLGDVFRRGRKYADLQLQGIRVDVSRELALAGITRLGQPQPPVDITTLAESFYQLGHLIRMRHQNPEAFDRLVADYYGVGIDQITEEVRSTYGEGAFVEHASRLPDALLRVDEFRAFARQAGRTLPYTRRLGQPETIRDLQSEAAEAMPNTKVTDESGRPRMFFHATIDDFTAFDTTNFNAHFGDTAQAANRLVDRLLGSGVSLEGRDQARERGDFPLGARTIPVFLNIENPMWASDAGAWNDADHVAGGLAVSELDDLGEDIDPEGVDRGSFASPELLAELQRLAAEIEEARNEFDDRGDVENWRESQINIDYLDTLKQTLIDHGVDGIIYENAFEGGDVSYIAFGPGQVKSAIANVGTFDLTEATILGQPVSTRLVTAKTPTKKFPVLEDPFTGNLRIDLAALKASGEAVVDRAAAAATSYVNYRPAKSANTSEKQIERFIKQMTDNILWLFGQVPPEIRERTRHWYLGANRTMKGMAARFGVGEPTATAVIAILSNQKEWYENISHAERLFSAMADQDAELNEASAELAQQLWSEKDPELAKLMTKGAKLSDMPDNTSKGAWVRVFDQANNDQTFNLYNPEGDVVGVALSKDGSPRTMRWQTNHALGAAVSVIEDQTHGNRTIKLGTGHKIRSFYNNILDPTRPDVTIDTHAVAAALLRPLSGSRIEVSHNFGGSKGAPASVFTGVNGMYPLYVEAYTRAADELGMLPREVQSVVWDAARLMFPPSSKREKTGLVAPVDDLWETYAKGRASYAATVQAVFDLAGGIPQPEWLGPTVLGQEPVRRAEGDRGAAEEGRDRVDEGELPSGAVPGGPAGRLRGGERAGAAGVAAGLGRPGEDVAARRGEVEEGRGELGRVREPAVQRAPTVDAAFAQATLESVEDLEAIGGARVRGRIPGTDFFVLERGTESQQEFADRLNAGAQTNTHGQSVTVKEASEFAGATLFLSRNGGVGVAIQEDGDIGSLFANPKLRKKGEGIALFSAAMEHAATQGIRVTADSYETKLTELYVPHGLRPVARVAWNDRYAPEGWNEEIVRQYNDGKPAVVLYVYDPVNAPESWDSTNPPDTIPTFDDWDEAARARDEIIESLPDPAPRDLRTGQLIGRPLARETADPLASGEARAQAAALRGAAMTRAMVRGTPLAEATEQVLEELTEEQVTKLGQPSLIKTPEFRRWFGKSVIVDENGNPRIVYHGTKHTFEAFKKRFGEHGLIFFSTNPDFAAEWPVGIGGTRESTDAAVAEQVKQARERWDQIFDEEFGVASKFAAAQLEDGMDLTVEQGAEILERTRQRFSEEFGFPTSTSLEMNLGLRVMPVYLSVQKVFNPAKDYKVLEDFLRSTPRFAKLVEQGSHRESNWIIYESIEVVQELKRLGYDGIWIRESSLEGSPTETIAVFEPEQIKSATANVGSYSPEMQSILRQKRRGEIVWRGPNATRFDITLFEGSDPSTLFHEASHMFFQVLGNLVRTGRASPRQREMFSALKAFAKQAIPKEELSPQERDRRRRVNAGLKRLGLRPMQGHPLALSDAEQEVLAAGFEQYLREGTAPSSALRVAFQRMRSWLVSIYRRVAGEPIERVEVRPGVFARVRINENIRETFSRLLASEQEIAEARSKLSLQPVEELRELMTAAEFEAYMAHSEKDLEKAETELRRTLLSEQEKIADMLERGADEVAVAVETEFANSRRMRLLAFLQKGIILGNPEPLPEGLTEKTKAGNRVAVTLNRKLLRKEFGRNIERTLPSNVSRAGRGLSANDLAPLLGYETGEQMIGELQGMRDYDEVLDEAVKRRMRSRFGSLMDEQARLKEEALQAAMNPGTVGRLIQELRFIQRALDPSDVRKQPFTAGQLKQRARELISQKQVGEIRPVVYQRAAAAAQREAATAIGAKKWAEAYDAKAKAAWAMSLFRAARDARSDAGTYVRYLTRMAQLPAQKMLGKAGRLNENEGDYRDIVNDILRQFELRPETGPGIARRQNRRAWAAEKIAQGEQALIPEWVMNETGKRHYRELRFSELKDVRDSVRNIEQLARLKVTLKGEQRRRSFEELRDRALEVLEATHPKVRPIPLSREGRTRTEKVRDWFSAVDAQLLRGEEIIRQMDGAETGPWRDLLWNPIADAQDRATRLQTQITKQITDVFAALPSAVRNALSERIEIPLLEGTLTREEIIVIALNMGNESNLRKLINANPSKFEGKWTEEALRQAVDELTVAEMDAVQQIWNVLESLWPDVAAMEQRLTGIAPPKLEPKPFEFKEKRYDGGYYPMVYTEEGIPGPSRHLDNTNTTQVLYDARKARAMTPHGHLIERIENFNAPISLDLANLPRHLDQVVHDLSFREAILDVDKVLRDRRVHSSLLQRLGRSKTQQWNQWLRYIANDNSSNNPALEGLLGQMRRNVTVAAMGFKASVWIQNFANIANIIERVVTRDVSMKQLSRAYRDLLVRPMGTGSMIHDISAEMLGRANNLERDIGHAALRLRSTKLGRTAFWARHFGFRMIFYTDTLTSYPLWLATYRTELERGKSERTARLRADSVVRTTLSSGAAKDLAAIQRGGEISKWLTMFYSWFSGVYMRQRALMHDIRQSQRMDDLTMSNLATYASRALLVVVIPAIISELLAGREPEDDEDWMWWSMMRVAGYTTGSVPVVRDVSRAIESHARGFRVDVDLGPGGRVLEEISRSMIMVGDLASGEKEFDIEKASKQALRLSGYVFGIPSTQAEITGGFLFDWISGDDSPESVWDAMMRTLYRRDPDDRGRRSRR